MFSFSIQNNIPPASAIIKQIKYGTAVGLTKTAKEGQAAVQAAVESKFTYRNKWMPQSNKFGIRIKAATPEDREAWIQTAATWLAKQQKGGTISAGQGKRVFPYTYKGEKYLAIPTQQLRPHGSTKVLVPRLWPSNLKNAFVVKSKKEGIWVLCVRFAPGRSGIVPMYVLIKQIMVIPKDAFYEPIQKVVNERLTPNVRFEVIKALSEIRF